METTPLISRPSRKSLWSRLSDFRFRQRKYAARTINLGELSDETFPSNYVCNQKYSLVTFLPKVLFEQFRFFLNLFFLLMALSQFFPAIRIGYLYTYWGPLGFVVSLSVIREAINDIRRYRRDKVVNGHLYERVSLTNSVDPATGCRLFLTESVPASRLRVGDIVILRKGDRVPADMILLRTAESSHTVFIRTDQLDGEIDWKLRIPVSSLQKMPSDVHLLEVQTQFFIEKPEKDIHSFFGTCTRLDEGDTNRLDIENTLWSGCVVASGQATGLVIYTGKETRSVMNNAAPRSKVGRLDLQVNDWTKVMFVVVVLVSFLMITLKGFNGPWFVFMFRFILLFSYIIPLSLRVNLELGKAVYSYFISHDKEMEGVVMRTTTIPEELGRIQYVLADKTGTLTKNEMVFQKLHLGNGCFDNRNFSEVEALLTEHITNVGPLLAMSPTAESDRCGLPPTPKQVWNMVLALSLCHNVTPVYKQSDARECGEEDRSDMSESVSDSCSGAVPQQQLCDYQASSPDEVALVKWTDLMGISLYKRDLHNISVKLRASNEILNFNILQVFPFTSESKMMGIIVKEEDSGEITYYVKGADVALSPLLGSSWLDAECGKLAAEGLRTLVVAMTKLSKNQYLEFESEYREARLAQNRTEKISSTIARLHSGLTLLGLTGVEDRLADRVPQTLAMLTTAGIKTWMLTGDKLETALCIARSLQLGGSGDWHEAHECCTRPDVYRRLDMIERRLCEPAPLNLIVDGKSLEMFLGVDANRTVDRLCECSGVVVARCSPTQKAEVVKLLRARKLGVAAVGDGGNDVAMIQEADVGVGIEGLEGRSASLAGDVSVRGMSALARLLLVHGRRSYLRSAALSLFIIHRGLVVSTMQAIFSCVFYFSSISLYPGLLMVGYGTFYTMLPVLSLVMDKDFPSSKLIQYPQLYKQLIKGRQISYNTFFKWTAISLFQGGALMYMTLFLFEDELIHIVAISFTSLILNELIMIALTVKTWHVLIVLAEVVSFLLYVGTLVLFSDYFDKDFLMQAQFVWKVLVITLVSCFLLVPFLCLKRKCASRVCTRLEVF